MAERLELDAVAADDALLDLLAQGGESALAALDDNYGDAAVQLLGGIRLAIDEATEEAALPEPTALDAEGFLARCAALNPAGDPLARKVATRTLGLGVAAITALSVSGVAAAVTGDPLSPYEKVISRVVDGFRPPTAFPTDRLDGLVVGSKAQILRVQQQMEEKAADRRRTEDGQTDRDRRDDALEWPTELTPRGREMGRPLPPGVEQTTALEAKPTASTPPDISPGPQVESEESPNTAGPTPTPTPTPSESPSDPQMSEPTPSDDPSPEPTPTPTPRPSDPSPSPTTPPDSTSPGGDDTLEESKQPSAGEQPGSGAAQPDPNHSAPDNEPRPADPAEQQPTRPDAPTRPAEPEQQQPAPDEKPAEPAEPAEPVEEARPAEPRQLPSPAELSKLAERIEQPKAEPTATVPAAKAKPAKVRPARFTPAEVKPAKVKPAKVKPAKVTPAKVRDGAAATGGKHRAARPVDAIIVRVETATKAAKAASAAAQKNVQVASEAATTAATRAVTVVTAAKHSR